MSTATAVVTINSYPNGVDNTQRSEIVKGTLAIGASPLTYVTNGLPITYANNEAIKSLTLTANWGVIYGIAGYVYQYDPAHNTVRIYTTAETSGVPLVELTNTTAIPSGVSGDTIYCRFEFARN